MAPSAPSAQITNEIIEKDGKQYPVRTYMPMAAPNDPYAGQWWENTANVTEVWSLPRSATTTTLAIIDTGFALQHEEFTNRWHVNAAESGVTATEAPSALNCSARAIPLDAACNLIDENRDGIVDNETGMVTAENPSRLNCSDQQVALDKSCNRIDDDGNGLVDDVTGWDFMNFDNSVQAGEINPNGDGTTHGTMVAGVAAATGANGVGMAGVDWATKILPLQALDDDSYGDTLSVGDAIYYAIDQKVDVISISLGSALPDDYVKEAVQTALAQGIIVVAASGNDACDCMVYPANYPEVLAVGALNTSQGAADFSSWGASLDILAPGTQMISTTWHTGNQTSAYVSGINGTSFATPLVGGLLTRMISERPEATPQQLIAALTENTNRLGLASTASRTSQLGFGSVNALSAVERMANARTSQMTYAYTPVKKGEYFNAATPLEETGSYAIQRCDQGVPGTTPIYELKKTGRQFFTASEVERHRAITEGYTSTFFAYGCMQQSHDVTTKSRNLNIFREFKNTPHKEQ